MKGKREKRKERERETKEKKPRNLTETARAWNSYGNFFQSWSESLSSQWQWVSLQSIPTANLIGETWRKIPWIARIKSLPKARKRKASEEFIKRGITRGQENRWCFSFSRVSDASIKKKKRKKKAIVISIIVTMISDCVAGHKDTYEDFVSFENIKCSGQFGRSRGSHMYTYRRENSWKQKRISSNQEYLVRLM